MDPDRIEPWIGTRTGLRFPVLRPDAARVRIEDIAHALANQCRFTGHVRSFYSVAQHSVCVSWGCDPEDALWGLLHDAPEAYLADVAKPVKVLPQMQGYAELEIGLQWAVAEAFGLPRDLPPSVKRADVVELVTEAHHLFDRVPEDWHLSFGIEPRSDFGDPLLPADARDLFLERFEELR